MSQHGYTTASQRVGKFKGEILAHAVPVEVLGVTGVQKQIPKNNSATVVYRRWLPYGGTDNKWITTTNVDTFAAAHLTTDGVTPSADTLSPTDVTVALNQYMAMYSYTDQAADMHEDDIPAEMTRQVGERVGVLREMVRYGIIKAGTNTFYAGGTTRLTVDETLSINLLRRVAKSLLANHAKQITQVLAPSANFATAPVEAGYLVFCHTDMEPAIRDLPGFKHVAEYGTRKPINEYEIGSVERFRFILSPELVGYINAGASVGATGLYSTGSSTIDVYPCLVVAEDAWGQVALRGTNAIDPFHVPVGQRDKSDPGGQRGYIGAKFYFNCTVLNQNWMAVVEAGTPSLA